MNYYLTGSFPDDSEAGAFFSPATFQSWTTWFSHSPSPVSHNSHTVYYWWRPSRPWVSHRVSNWVGSTRTSIFSVWPVARSAWATIDYFVSARATGIFAQPVVRSARTAVGFVWSCTASTGATVYLAWPVFPAPRTP